MAPGATGGVGGSGGSTGGAGLDLVRHCFASGLLETCDKVFGGSPSAIPSLTLLDAEDVAAGAKFTALGGIGALLEVPGVANEARYRVARPLWNDRAAPVELLGVAWPEAPGEWTVRHIWSGTEASMLPALGGKTALALGCNDVGCRLLGATAGELTLTPLADLQLPEGAAVELLAVYQDTVCAYGADLYCLRASGWELSAAIPEGAGRRFAKVLAGEGTSEDLVRSVAATDAGALLVEQSSGEWAVQSAPSDSAGAIVSLERNYSLVSVLYASGEWLVFDLFSEFSQVCTQGLALALAAPASPYPDGGFRAVSTDGTFYVGPVDAGGGPRVWCQTAPDSYPNLIATAFEQCGVAVANFALTESKFISLFGAPMCGYD